MMLRDVTSRGEGGFATRDSLSTSWLKVNASLARERFEHKRSLLECATVKALAVKLWRFGLPTRTIGWDWEDSGRASLEPGQSEAVSTCGIAGFPTMWAKLFLIDRSISGRT
jgi:hypothetical protein